MHELRRWNLIWFGRNSSCYFIFCFHTPNCLTALFYISCSCRVGFSHLITRRYWWFGKKCIHICIPNTPRMFNILSGTDAISQCNITAYRGNLFIRGTANRMATGWGYCISLSQVAPYTKSQHGLKCIRIKFGDKISNFILHFIGHVITCPCWKWS